jgi:hypothetical protein
MLARAATLGLMLCAASLASAASAAAGAPASDEAQLVGLEQLYAQALMRRDLNFLKDYYAPDWRGGDWMGFANKTNILNLVKSGRYVIKSMVLRDLKVRVFGDIALVQGLDDEITSMHGKDTSGTWGWTDVFARRGGRWFCIASQTTRVQRTAR